MADEVAPSAGPSGGSGAGDVMCNGHAVPGKYWHQRRSLWARFVEVPLSPSRAFTSNVRMDTVGWFSVTPEAVAVGMSERLVELAMHPADGPCCAPTPKRARRSVTAPGWTGTVNVRVRSDPYPAAGTAAPASAEKAADGDAVSAGQTSPASGVSGGGNSPSSAGPALTVPARARDGAGVSVPQSSPSTPADDGSLHAACTCSVPEPPPPVTSAAGFCDAGARDNEPHARHPGIRLESVDYDGVGLVVYDLFAGVGGNTVSFARQPNVKLVVAVEGDAQRLAMAQHNCHCVYGVPRARVMWLTCDVWYFSAIRLRLAPCWCGRPVGDSSITSPGSSDGTCPCTLPQPDHVFMAPPWGGPEYSATAFDMHCGLSTHTAPDLARAWRHHLGLYSDTETSAASELTEMGGCELLHMGWHLCCVAPTVLLAVYLPRTASVADCHRAYAEVTASVDLDTTAPGPSRVDDGVGADGTVAGSAWGQVMEWYLDDRRTATAKLLVIAHLPR